MTAPIPLYFVVGQDSKQELARYEALDVGRDWAAFKLGKFNWIVQTGLLLRARGMDCRFSALPTKNGINFGHTDTRELDDETCFTIGILADRAGFFPRPNLVVVQNQTQADPSQGRHWLPHWPQPGLVPRDPNRRGVRTVAYAGNLFNFGLAPAIFGASCRRLDLVPNLLGASKAADYSKVDVLVGIRSLDRQTHDHKPASKLVNAWLAGIPFIGGYDSAFAQIGTPGGDYLRVSDLAEFDAALARLKTDPVLYAELVTNGRSRARHYNQSAVTDAWLTFIREIAEPAFRRWSANRSPAG